MADTQKKAGVFSETEKAAMRQRSKELAAEAKQAKNRAQGESDVQAAITAMPEPDRSMAKKIHEIITTNFPDLWTKTWYGFPTYTNSDGKIYCFFQPASKFKYRYSTLTFQDGSNLDEGSMWPVSYAIVKLDTAEEKRIIVLVKKAIS